MRVVTPTTLPVTIQALMAFAESALTPGSELGSVAEVETLVPPLAEDLPEVGVADVL